MTLVWFAGVGWEDVPGTDRRMVGALAEAGVDVVWMDASRPGVWSGWRARSEPAVTHPQPGVTRLRVPAPPGFSRPPMRVATGALRRATLRRNVSPNAIRAVVVANPVVRFPPRHTGRRIYYVTDDWISGAPLMGYSTAWVRECIRHNIAEADVVVAVSPGLLDSLDLGGTRAIVIPNGAPDAPIVDSVRREPVAGVVGQLNERLDLELLEAVVAAGIRLRLIGPRAACGDAFASRLDALLRMPGVEWTGPVAPTAIPAHLAALSVGLTPYADTSFNRASYPLKTLEYLAAGLPVVSTDLPASRAVRSAHVRIAADTPGFVASTREFIAHPDGKAAERRAVAAEHSWTRRAEDLRALSGV
ncbi:glycosyltransferase [Microbacterium telephonicum]|uniref:Teichuronic acid biosynthesis glycosyltransferase TuaH n=1 Tax=Microbacterium telephonicum TaxID=1714841 RepID=A0A498BYW4_9MICO|nr:glycosyltransferase [Microbacterium telephonicum]RLK47947.1 teichuronic acid biosynthesis glycosyltransferase TuaH [Microbacterium telephonicum]